MQLSIFIGGNIKNSKTKTQKNEDVTSIFKRAKSKVNPTHFILSIISNFQHT